MIVEDAQHLRRKIDHCRAVLPQIEKTDCIHGRRVAGQQQRLGIHQGVPDADLVAGVRADTRLAVPQRGTDMAGMELRNT